MLGGVDQRACEIDDMEVAQVIAADRLMDAFARQGGERSTVRCGCRSRR